MGGRQPSYLQSGLFEQPEGLGVNILQEQRLHGLRLTEAAAG